MLFVRHRRRSFTAAVAVALLASLAVIVPADRADAAIPSAPVNVNATPQSWHSAQVSWGPGQVPGTSYKVQVRKNGALQFQYTGQPCCTKLVDGLQAGTQYQIWVYATTFSGDSLLPGFSNNFTTFAAGTPDPITVASASASSGAPTVTVSWTPPGGNAPTYIETTVLLSGQFVTKAKCFTAAATTVVPSYACDGNSVMVTGLAPGTQYTFFVQPFTAVGSGLGKHTNAVTVATGCPSDKQTCITVDGTDVERAATGVASGLLHTHYDIPEEIDPLKINHWRIPIPEYAGGLDPVPYNNVRAAVPNVSLTVLVSDAWKSFTNHEKAQGSGYYYALPPWNPDLDGNIGETSDWATYSAWVTNYVEQVNDLVDTTGGPPIAYWEVMNEPDALPAGGNAYLYWHPSGVDDAHTATFERVLSMFEITYRAIKAADPTAKVIGPSFALFTAYRGQRGEMDATPNLNLDEAIDMKSFLEYSDIPGDPLVWDALAWHDPGNRLNTEWNDYSEDQLALHVQTTQALLAEHPALGDPKILINEYGPPDRWVLPGWQAGLIAAMEGNGVTEANHSCFNSLNYSDDNDPGGNCSDVHSTLNGQVSENERDTRPIYWVNKLYADITTDADVVAASSSHPWMGAFATTHDATSTLNVLAGRYINCNSQKNLDCQVSAAAAADSLLTFTFPFSAPNGVEATITRIEPSTNAGPIAEPTSSPVTVTSFSGGVGTIDLSSVKDGEAILISITPI